MNITTNTISFSKTKFNVIFVFDQVISIFFVFLKKEKKSNFVYIYIVEVGQ